jgi:hypothetical protein
VAFDFTERERQLATRRVVIPPSFPNAAECEIHSAVKLWPALRNLFPVLAILGLVLGPLAVSSPRMTAAASAEMAAMEPMDMGEDMPCCPTKQAPPCDRGCPDMALCFAKCSPAIPTVSAALALPLLAGLVLPGDEARWDTRAERPPPRPPRA